MIFYISVKVRKRGIITMSHFAVLDTETIWSDEVMSLVFVIADENGFEGVNVFES